MKSKMKMKKEYSQGNGIVKMNQENKHGINME